MNPRFRLFVALALGIATLAGGQAFRENVRVGLLSVRLEVRGSDGRPVRDLKASEVKLRVDGKEVSVEGVDPTGGPTPERGSPSPDAAPVQTAAGTSAAPVAAGAAAAVSSAARSDLYLAILVDETSSNSFDRRDVYRQIQGFLRDKAAAGVHMMLERFDGRLWTECAWTTDMVRVLEAAKKMSKRAFDSRMPSPASLADETRNGRQARDVQQQVDLAARRSFDGILLALIQFPTDVPGKKGLVFITDGTPLMSPFDLALTLAHNASSRDSSSQRGQGIQQADAEDRARQIGAVLEEEALSTYAVFGAGAGADATWARRMAVITNKALELDIAFYPVDSEAIDRGTNPGVSSKWPGRSMPGVQGGSSLPDAGSMSARVAVAQSMETLASTSGGQTILVSNQLSDKLAGVATARDEGYLVTFRDPFAADHRFHRIEITVERPGVKITHRRGYRVLTDEERTLDAIVANLGVTETENPLHAKVSMEISSKDGGRDIVTMRLEYLQPPEAPGHEAGEREVRIWAVCSDDDGNRARPISRQARARRVPDQKPAAYADTFQLGLPPGPYIWSIALQDVPTGMISYLVARKVL